MKEKIEDIIDIIVPIVFTVIIVMFSVFMGCVIGELSNESKQEKALETDVYSVETYHDEELDITYLILKDRLGDVIRADVMIEGE